MKRQVMCVFGTRPEAVKMAPVVKCLRDRRATMDVRVCVTGQHRELLDQVLDLFAIVPDVDLDLMQPGQDVFDVTCRVLQALRPVLTANRPDLVLVHGDTTTTMAASLAAYYLQIPVGHVEAGLRTGNKLAPFPEEINRKITGGLADLHFAPTAKAKENLIREGVSEDAIAVTGNTVIDALLFVRDGINRQPAIAAELQRRFSWLAPTRRIVVVTAHRRENFGRGCQEICQAIVDLAGNWPLVDFVYPVHLNPNVQESVDKIIRSTGPGNIHLIEPLDYRAFVYLLDRCDLVLTDSGGIQEEAPSLGKPVVVMRDATERPEAVDAGCVRLAGSSRRRIVLEVERLLADDAWYQKTSQAITPYGDGHAAERIAEIVAAYLAKSSADRGPTPIWR